MKRAAQAARFLLAETSILAAVPPAPARTGALGHTDYHPSGPYPPSLRRPFDRRPSDQHEDPTLLRRASAARRHPHSRMSVVWVLGMPGSGKSTLAEALRRVVSSVAPAVILDGDALRAALDPGEPPANDASDQSARLGRLARLLASQRLVVIATDSSSDPRRLAWNKANLPGYREIVLQASMPILRRRDLHGSYARTKAHQGAAAGPAAEVVEWHSPAAPDLTIAMDEPDPPELLALRVAMLIPEYVAAATAVARTPPGRMGPPMRTR